MATHNNDNVRYHATFPKFAVCVARCHYWGINTYIPPAESTEDTTKTTFFSAKLYWLSLYSLVYVSKIGRVTSSKFRRPAFQQTKRAPQRRTSANKDYSEAAGLNGRCVREFNLFAARSGMTYPSTFNVINPRPA